MSSTFVQVTVVPTGTVIVCGPKTKLSIFTAAAGAEGSAFAVTREDNANSMIAISTGTATPEIQSLFFVMIFSSLNLDMRYLLHVSFAADQILS
jgi:hypothetical protein